MHARNSERPYAVTQRIDGRDVEERVTDDDRERPLNQRAQMVAKNCRQRDRGALVPIQSLKRRRLLERSAPHISPIATRTALKRKGTRHAQSTNAASPNPIQQQKKEADRNEEADRRAELRKHAVPCPPALRRVFDRDQRRATPFATKPDPLQEAQSGEPPRGEHQALA